MMLINVVNVERSLATSRADGTKAWHHPLHPEIPWFSDVISDQKMFAFNLGGCEGSPLICSYKVILVPVTFSVKQERDKALNKNIGH